MATATKNAPQVDILLKRRNSMHFHGLALTLIVILALTLTQPTLTLSPNPDLLQGFSSFSSTGIQFFGIQILSKLTDIIFNKPISLGLSDKLHYNVCNCPDMNRIILHQFLTNKVFRKICSKMITSIIRYHTAIHYIMSITRDRFRPYWVSSGGCKKHSIINMLKKTNLPLGAKKRKMQCKTI